MPQPNKIPLAFAASGDKNVIPESTETTGLASWREGFPAITSAPFSEGGIAPKRADFNGIFNALSQAVMWMQQGGLYAYDVNTDYEAGNVVFDAGGLYVANSANGPSSAVVQPSSDTTGATWKLVRLDLATQSAAGYMSAADKTALDGVPTTYLLLAGGTLTGDITTKNIIMSSGSIRTLLDSQALYQYGGTGWQHGAQITLFGKDHSTNPGDFTIHADNGTNSCDLLGRPNGALTWGGKDVFTSDNCTVTSATGSPPYSYKAKFANGLMVQCYYGTSTTDENSRFQWTYDEAFIEDPFVSITNGMSTQALNLYNWDKTRIIVNVCGTTGGQAGSNIPTEMVIIALGRWK